jgi:hypothetical protein
MRLRVGAFGAVLLLVAGCESYVQDSSGQAYLAKYELQTGPTGRAMDEAVRVSAAVEPLLTFPARIGIARVNHGLMTPIPPDELEAWAKLGERLGPSVGEFLPVSPLIAKLASDALPGGRDRRYGDAMTQTIEQIRVGAARQHIETVLIYEVAGKNSDSASPLSLADLTVVGAYLMPSRVLRAQGVASALLVDVRNGYPYGFTDPVVVDDHELSPSVGSDRRKQTLQGEAEAAATIKLVDQVEAMVAKLRPKLEARRSEAAAPQSPAGK